MKIVLLSIYLSLSFLCYSLEITGNTNHTIDPLFIIILIILILVFITGIIIGINYGSILGKNNAQKEFDYKIPDIRKEAIMRSRSVLTGQFSEQLAPLLPNFPYNPNEVRFIGKPVDLIVFEGLDEGEIKKIIFVEVKSGKSNLNHNESSLKKAIENGNVKWELYRIPDFKLK